LPIEVYHYHRRGQTALSGSILEFLGHESRIDIPRFAIAVHEHGVRTKIGEGKYARRKRQGADQDVRPRGYPGELEAEVQSCRSGTERDGMACFYDLGELRLERIDLRPKGGNPIRREGLQHQHLFLGEQG
jgi:hypothetical protein